MMMLLLFSRAVSQLVVGTGVVVRQSRAAATAATTTLTRHEGEHGAAAAATATWTGVAVGVTVLEGGDATARLEVPDTQQHHLRHRRRVAIQPPADDPQLPLSRSYKRKGLGQAPAERLEANDLVGHHVRPRDAGAVVGQQRRQSLHVQATVQKEPPRDLCRTVSCRVMSCSEGGEGVRREGW